MKLTKCVLLAIGATSESVLLSQLHSLLPHRCDNMQRLLMLAKN